MAFVLEDLKGTKDHYFVIKIQKNSICIIRFFNFKGFKSPVIQNSRIFKGIFQILSPIVFVALLRFKNWLQTANRLDEPFRR